MEQIRQELKELKISFLRLQFTDLFGRIKNVEIPSSRLDEALSEGIPFDGSSIEGFLRVEESDMFLRPELNTLSLFPRQWKEDRTGSLICNVYTAARRPFAGDPRAILQRTLNQTSLDVRISFECEFFLLVQDERTKQYRLPADSGSYFDASLINTLDACRQDMVLALQEMNIPVRQCHHEISPGQHELNLGPLPPLLAADCLQRAKLMIRTVARRYRCFASFMPQPFDDIEGSGLHTQVSFPASSSCIHEGQVDHFLAGTLDHAEAFTAIANPLVNSYKRLLIGKEAPLWVTWSSQAESPFVRRVIKDGQTTLEFRSPDSGSNPYLLLAAILSAGHDGMVTRAKLQHETNQSPPWSLEVAWASGIRSLPRQLGEALDALREDEVLQEALGEHAYRQYELTKQAEWEAYLQKVHVWEREMYLDIP